MVLKHVMTATFPVLCSTCSLASFSTRKVTILEDPDQNIHLKNLSLHQATTEEEALNLLFLGDTNRMIAEVTGISLQVTFPRF